MIGGDQVDRAVAERSPQLFAILAFANRRRAFEFRGAVGDFFRGEGQVVRASLDADLRALDFAAAAVAEAHPTKTDARCERAR